jgi:hypothetical protein
VALALYAVLVDGQSAPRHRLVESAALGMELITATPTPDRRGHGGDRVEAAGGAAAAEQRDPRGWDGFADAGGGDLAVWVGGGPVRAADDTIGDDGGGGADRGGDRGDSGGDDGAGADDEGGRGKGGGKRGDKRGKPPAQSAPPPEPTTEVPTPTPVPPGHDRGDDEPADGETGEGGPERTEWEPEPGHDGAGTDAVEVPTG